MKKIGSRRRNITHHPESSIGPRQWPVRLGRLCLGGALALAALSGYGQERTQEHALEPPSSEPLEVITIGTRMPGRTTMDSAVPVDVVSAQEIRSVPATDVSDVLSKVIPSFNITANPVNDGSSHIRPSQLRGMDSDKALVLVNGKRRHRAAVVFLDGWGAHGPDLNPIPTIALKSVEVLRDGASALYGSDAIAGVINFNLRDSNNGGSFSVTGGEYAHYEHEREYQIAGNKGLALGDSGFFNISAEWARRDRADRGTVFNFPIAESGKLPSQAINTVMPNAVSIDGVPLGTRYGPDALTERYINGTLVLTPGSDGIPDDPDTRFKDHLTIPEQAWGATPQESRKVFFNSGYDLTQSMKLYSFGNYMSKQSSSSFYYRSPDTSQLLPLRKPDGSIYNPRTLYPGGYTPRFYGDVRDYSLVVGLAGRFGADILYDFSGRYGRSTIGYDLKNSMNPSMGPDTPTQFHPGDLQSNEASFNADLSKPVDLGWHSPVNVAVGFEYRNEGYKISKGDPLSYFAGPYSRPDPWNLEITQQEVDANPSLGQIGCRIPGLESVGKLCPAGDPVNNAVGVGADGFPGYSPDFTSNYHRRNTAGYLTLESDLTQQLFGSLAARFEDFQDFGSNFSWRTAGRYRLTDELSFRGSVGTGFKAPTPGQISTINVATRVVNQNLVETGIFPATHPASIIFGATPLRPETSFSYTGGVTFTPLESLNAALDYYYIKLKNRLTFSGIFTPTPAQEQQLAALNIPGGEAIQGVQFYTNDADTRTTGFDLVVDYHRNWGAAGVTSFWYRGNWNKTAVVRRPIRPDGSTLVSDSRKYLIEHAPGYRGVFGVDHTWDRLILDVRLNSYGPFKLTDDGMTQFQSFRSVQQVDMSLGWKVNNSITATVGGRNIFSQFPDRDTTTTCCGQIYPDTAADWFGSFWYLNVSASF